jgi:hypothetical protein
MEDTRKGKRRHLSAQEWQGVLHRFAGAGESIGAFCRHERLSTSSFRLWRNRLMARSAEAPARAPMPGAIDSQAMGFVDLGTLGMAPQAPSGRLELKLELGGGVTLHIVRG